MAISNMMNRLPERPTFGPVRRVELLIAKSADCRSQIRGEIREDVDVLVPRSIRSRVKFADRKSKIEFGCCSTHNQPLFSVRSPTLPRRSETVSLTGLR